MEKRGLTHLKKLMACHPDADEYFLQDKNGNLESKNKMLCCRPVWFSNTTGIQTHSFAGDP